MHRARLRQILRDLLAHALLCCRERKRQRGKELFMQAARLGSQRRRMQSIALLLCGQLRQLLRQQLLHFQALPSRMGVILKLRQRHIGCWIMQK